MMLGAITDTGPEVAARCEKQLEKDLKEIDLKDREYRKRVVKNGAGCTAAGFCAAYTGGTAAGACEWAARQLAGPLYDVGESVVNEIAGWFGGGEEKPPSLVKGPKYSELEWNSIKLDSVVRANYAYLQALKVIAKTYNDSVLPLETKLGISRTPMTQAGAEIELYKSFPERNENIDYWMNRGDPNAALHAPVLKRDLVGKMLLMSTGAQVPVNVFQGPAWNASMNVPYITAEHPEYDFIQLLKEWTKNIGDGMAGATSRFAARTVRLQTRVADLEGKIPAFAEEYRKKNLIAGLGVLGVGAIAATIIYRRKRRAS